MGPPRHALAPGAKKGSLSTDADIKQTGAFSIEQASARIAAGVAGGTPSDLDAHRNVLAGLPIPSVLL